MVVNVVLLGFILGLLAMLSGVIYAADISVKVRIPLAAASGMVIGFYIAGAMDYVVTRTTLPLSPVILVAGLIMFLGVLLGELLVTHD